MIKSIKIYNRFNMEMFAKTDGLNLPCNYWYMVSIYGKSQGPLITKESLSVFHKLGLQKFVSLNFWDIDDKQFHNLKLEYPEATLFNKGHAAKIIALLDIAQKDIKDSVLVIHCNAGISRSAAVGTFACDYCQLDYNKFIKDNPGTYANQYVLNILRRKANIIPFSGIIKDGIDWDEINEIGEDRFEKLVLKKGK